MLEDEHSLKRLSSSWRTTHLRCQIARCIQICTLNKDLMMAMVELKTVGI